MFSDVSYVPTRLTFYMSKLSDKRPLLSNKYFYHPLIISFSESK